MGSNHGQQRAPPDDTPRYSAPDSSASMAGVSHLATDPRPEQSQKTQFQATPGSMPVYAGHFQPQQQHPSMAYGAAATSAGMTSGMPGAHGVHHPPHPQQPGAISTGMLPPPRRPPITTPPHNMHSASAATLIPRPLPPHSPRSQHSLHRHPQSHSLSLMHRTQQQQQQQQQPAHHRPYDVLSPAPASRTFWNHYETGLLVRLWLELEAQFVANKRNAGVWAHLAQRLTEQSARHRTVRECRIKWKNMWAKHRDLVNALHMSHDAKLREFPYFEDFLAIRQRSSLHLPHQSSAQHQEASEGKVTPSDDGQYYSRAGSHPYSPSSAPVAGPAPAYTPPAPHLAADSQWSQQSYRQTSPGTFQLPHQASLASILSPPLSSNARHYPVSSSTLHHLLSPAPGPADVKPRIDSSQASPAAYAHAAIPGSSEHSQQQQQQQQQQRGQSIRDIAGLLHHLDQASDNYDDDDDDDIDIDIDSDSIDKSSGVDGMIARMRVLASEASAPDVSSAVYLIMNYVERESRRRHMQSERHHRVVAALADILTQSTASSTAAPSAAASRRSSGVGRGWSPQQQMGQHGLSLQSAVPRPPSCESTPTDSPPQTRP